MTQSHLACIMEDINSVISDHDGKPPNTDQSSREKAAVVLLEIAKDAINEAKRLFDEDDWGRK